MSAPRDEMELKEEAIRAQYEAALAMLQGSITRRVWQGAGARRWRSVARDRHAARFRSTDAGLVTRSTARPGGVRLIERVEAVSATTFCRPASRRRCCMALRRALAIALAMGETFSAQSGLAELKKANLEGRLPERRSKVEFSELLAARRWRSVHLCQCHRLT
jgi:hypothetical protein